MHAIGLLAYASGIVTVSFLFSILIVLTYYLKRNNLLLAVALLFVCEATLWFTYAYNVHKLGSFVNPKWHLKNMNFPLWDIVVTLFGLALAMNIFQWNSQDSYLIALQHMSSVYKTSLIIISSGLILKFFIAKALIKRHFEQVEWGLKDYNKFPKTAFSDEIPKNLEND